MDPTTAPLIAGDLDTIAEWIEADGDVLVSVEYERSCVSADSYLVRSAEALRHLIEATRFWPHRVNLFFFRGPFPLRGPADDVLLRRARAGLREGEHFYIVDPAIAYPMTMSEFWIGQTHQDVAECIKESEGRPLAIGRHPMDDPAEEWDREHPGCAIRRRSFSGTG